MSNARLILRWLAWSPILALTCFACLLLVLGGELAHCGALLVRKVRS